MTDVSITPITAGFNSTNALNNNFDALAAAIRESLSKEATSNNQMNAPLDMNGYPIQNLLLEDVLVPQFGLSWDQDTLTIAAEGGVSSATLPLATTTTSGLLDSEDKKDYDNHITSSSNPHNVTKEQVGLGDVDNTSDADKPISTAQQEALDDKSDVDHTHPVADLEQGDGTENQVPTLQSDGSVVWADPPSASGGEANTASNVGTGEGWYKQKSGSDLEFKTVLEGDGVRVTSDTDELTIHADTETVHTASSGSFDRSDGGIQEYTLTADETISVSLDSGQSLTLHLTDGDAYTVTWPTMTWVGGSAPTLTSADVIEFWQVGSTLYGVYVGSVA